MSDTYENEPTLLPWIDMETSGLDEHGPDAWVGEIGFAITDRSLKIVDSISFVIEPHHLAPMVVIDGSLPVENDIVYKMHRDNGLFAAIASGQGEHIRRASLLCGEFLGDYIDPGTRPLCGSSLRHDRNWLQKFAPELHAFFHYRSIDVSAIKETIARWWPDEVPEFDPPPAKLHRVDPDIVDSINEFKSYMAILERGVTPFHAKEFQS